jgi:mono/diheme cytochrome c family protein
MKELARGAMALGLFTLACKGADADLPPAYRKIRVPEDRLSSAAALEHGRVLFLEHCALCHGVEGDGRGRRREGFARPPRDFRSSLWRTATTPRRVFHAVREGLTGTAMPSWKALPDDELWDLTAYVLSIARASR